METNQKCTESDDDDYETYFLQPASSPYNIADKVKEANAALYNEIIDSLSKDFKVKFRDDLVDFEPDVTDDDVTSIESYNESIDYSIIQQHQAIDEHGEIQEQNLANLNLNIFDTVEEEPEEDEDCTHLSDEEGEGSDEREIIEEVDDILCGEEVKERHIFKQETIDVDAAGEVENNLLDNSVNEDVTFKVETSFKETKQLEKQALPKTTIKDTQKPIIECKSHCIEKLDPGLNLYINKLKIREKPPRDCPTLKLQKRNCCDKNPVKLEQRLPVYGGHKSEYGLSLAQLQRREKIKQVTKAREDKRYQIIEEFKHRKMQQNEEIFCQWLKNLSRRKRDHEIRNERSKRCLVPTIFPFPGSENSDQMKNRPKTAQLPKRSPKKPKRPSTSTACVFIEVPQSVLNRGIRVGDVLVNRNNDLSAKKLHILTFS